MKLRLIEKNARNLPADFAVAAGKTAREGLEDCFNLLENPHVTLAVWNGAQELVTHAEKKSIAAAIAKPRGWKTHTYKSYGSLETPFARLSQELHAPDNDPGIAAWRRSAFALAGAAQGLSMVNMDLAALPIPLTLRTAERLVYPTFHTDNLREGAYRMIRTVFNGATRFAAAADVDPEKLKRHFMLAPDCFREKMTTVWTIHPWSLAVMRNQKDQPEIAHSEFYRNATHRPGLIDAGAPSQEQFGYRLLPHADRRAIEIWNFGKK